MVEGPHQLPIAMARLSPVTLTFETLSEFCLISIGYFDNRQNSSLKKLQFRHLVSFSRPLPVNNRNDQTLHHILILPALNLNSLADLQNYAFRSIEI